MVLSVISAATCNEFIVLNSPKSVEFKGSSDLHSESLTDILAAPLGFSIGDSAKFDGLFVKDPFSPAQSVVTVVVEGVESLDFKNAKSFNLVGNDLSFESQFLTEVMDHSHLAVDVDLIDKVNENVETPFGTLERPTITKDVQYLKEKGSKYDKEILTQFAYLENLGSLFTEHNEQPTALNVRVSLKLFTASHQPSSPAIAEAQKLLISAVEKLSATVSKATSGNAVFAVITVGEHHSRAKRQAGDEDTKSKYNLAELTDKNYPVVFNIMFWFSIIFVFSLIAISLALSNVEDKDSIIYRMTGARGKKDN